MNDWELIQEYTAHGSDEAFRTLVVRHAGLVYNTALRRLNGDTHFAQDVAQIVFSNLARKAHRFGSDIVLAGWLHRDTCYTTLEVLRRERRRHAREEAAMSMNDTNSDPPQPDWEQLSPWLDEALHQIPTKDRDVLLLRFFEQRSLTDIGQRLGFSESGASRRVSRALDKLRTLLARRGVVTSSAGLAALLTANAAQAAPAGVAAALAVSSLSASVVSTTSTTILTLMASLKAKICLVLLAGAVVTTPVLLVRNYSERRQVAAEQSRDIEVQHLTEGGDNLRAVLTFAGDHGGMLPQSLEEIGLTNSKYELLVKGASLTAFAKPEAQVVLKQRQRWRTPEGLWKRVYCYADGHSQAQTALEE